MRIVAVAMVGMALALSGCGSEPEPDPAAPAAGPAAPRTSPGGFADAVSAVLASEGEAVSGLSFLIDAAPVAGKPFALTLYFTGMQPVNGVQVALESADLVTAPASATVNVTGAQPPASLDLVVTAQKAGLWELVVSLRTAGSAATTLYKIPVMVAGPG